MKKKGIKRKNTGIKKPAKECIVVLGMHRSGTSVLTGLVSILGGYVGTDLMPSTKDNPKGYFENNKIYRLNEKILEENNATWDDYLFTIESISPEIFNSYVLSAKTIIRSELKFVNKILVKDPRMCILFPIWERAFKELNIKLKLIFAYRSPMEVALSMHKRDHFSIEKGLMLWSHFFFQAELLSRSHKRLVIEYSRDFDDLTELLEKIGMFIGLKVTDTSLAQANKFYSPHLKHHQVPLGNISDEIPRYLVELINIVKKKQFSHKAKIDPLRNEFNKSMSFYLHDQTKLLSELENTKDELDEIDEAYHSATQQNDQKNIEIAKFELKIKDITLQNIERNEKVLELKKQLNQAVSEISVLNKLKSEHKIVVKALKEAQIKHREKEEKTAKNVQLELVKIKKKNHALEEYFASAEKLFFNLLNDKALYKRLSTYKFNRAYLYSFFSKKKSVNFHEKKAILSSGLFSPLYYLVRYPDISNGKVNPLTHFCQFGWKEQRQPSSFFSCKKYLAQNKDVAYSGVNPLLHYVRFGQKEGRKPFVDGLISNVDNTIKSKLQKKNMVLTNHTDFLKLSGLKSNLNVAVIVHVYYLDLWEEILNKLKTIQHPYTLYISTTNDLYEQVLMLEKPSVTVKTYQTDNVGMDIYPFIKLLNYLKEDKIDIFCKLHTKKGNDFSGRLWRETLLRHTIGSNDIFSSIAYAFEKDSSLKLVGSAFFYKSINYLSKGYLKEIKKVAQIFSEEGDMSFEKSGFFAGTMFWGRVQDFFPFHELLSKDDFTQSNNLSNSDGTFTHIIERIFGLPHVKNKKIGLVYHSNARKEVVLQKMNDNHRAISTNISATIRLLASFNSDYYLLKNARYFPIDRYKQNFPFLDEYEIDPIYHYLTIGRFYQDVDLPDDLSKVFGLHRYNIQHLPQYLYLGLYGSIISKGNLDSNLEFDFLRYKLGIAEMHLIDWKVERNKIRNHNLVSIIIPAFHQTDLTNKCLESIIENEAGLEYEIILVNNSQDIFDIQELEKWSKYPFIKVIHNDENLNFALGCNLGYSRSIGSKIVFLNNDTTVTKDWLVNLIYPLNDENISVAQPRLLYPDGKLQCMGLVFSGKSKLAYPIYQNLDITKEVMNRNRLFNAVTGACLAVRAGDFALVDGFDTTFINGLEDVDFCLKINRLKNTKAIYASASIVYHHEGKSPGRGLFVANNRKIFIERYSGKIYADDMVHYKRDGYEVHNWRVDSDHFKKLKVENYIPLLRVSQKLISDHDYSFSECSFYIAGDKKNDGNKKSILVAAHTVGKEIFGGERSFLDMVDAIDKRRYNIIITLPNNKNPKYIDLLKTYSTKIYIVRYKMWGRNGLNSGLVKVLESIYRNNQVSLVYVNTIMCKEPLRAAKNLNIISLTHIREVISNDKHLMDLIPRQPVGHILSSIASDSSYIVANSKATYNILNCDNKFLLYNKIDVASFKKSDNNASAKKVVFGLISSNIPKKGIFDFLEISKLCRKKIPNAHFILIGPNNSYAKQIRKKIGLLSHANFTIEGYVSSPLEAIQKCNVLLSLSHFAESFGRTVGESLAAGRPVIAYNAGAIPELIEHSKNGFLVNENDIHQVVTHIEYFCNNVRKILEMGEYGRNSIAKITSSSLYINKLNEIVDTCAASKSDNTSLKRGLTIIIPIYNAYEEVLNCIDSVINTTVLLKIRIILIDDASTDERIKKVLSKYEKLANIDVIFNKLNLGYTKTINKGINLAKSNDIILLNSDTIVTFGWVEGLLEEAYSEKHIGTITAMSDNAGAFSFPEQDKENPKPKSMQYNNYAQVMTRNSRLLAPIVTPTGSGFCLFIKRNVFNDIGIFDDKLFPRGYGEENDFCVRATMAGWKNIISTKAFVFHIRTASFGEEKKSLISESSEKIKEKYPNYQDEVKETFSSTGIKELRSVIKSDMKYLKKISK